MAAIQYFAGTSHAQSHLLSAELVSSSQGVRNGAPATVVWKLISQSSSILEGRFQVTVFDDREIIGRVVTDDVVLGSGEQWQRITLPALEFNSPSRIADVQLLFIGEQKTIDLGRFTLRFPGTWERTFALCVCDPWNSRESGGSHSLIDALRFETYNPDINERSATTALHHVRPDEMPQHPLGFCEYDMVVLVEEGLKELRGRQLDALITWIDAGGSALILPAAARLDSVHISFLNRLSRAPEDAPKFIVDPNGRLAAPDGLDQANAFFIQRGLGRAAVVPGDPARVGADSHDFRRVAAFLWKIRADQASEFSARARWDSALLRAAPEGDLPDNMAIGRLRPTMAALAPLPLQSGDQMMQHLLPKDLRVLPLSLVGLLLFGYVLLIGPGDYLFLGALRQRKWTWALFPAVTVGCAWLVVGLAHWYMAVNDDRKGVTFLDVGDNNRIVRSNRFEVLFSGTHRTAKTEMQEGIFTAMNHQQFGTSTWSAYQQATNYGPGADDRFKLVGAPQIEGRYPFRYTVSQQLPQWTPQLNRQFTFDNEATVNDFDWNQFADPAVFHPRDFPAGDALHRIESAVRAKFGPEARVFLLYGPDIWPSGGGAGALFDVPSVPLHQYSSRPARIVNGRVVAQDAGAPHSFLTDTCAFDDGGLFRVVSRISPTGGRNFEDLSLLDRSDPDQWLLVVVVERGRDMFIYRKLYTGVR